MKKLDTNGFAFIEGLIILVVLVAIGFVGWRVVSSNQKDQNANKFSSNQKSPKNTKEADIVLKNFGLASLDDVLWNKCWLSPFSSLRS